ncbi:MAG: hypothetical protein ABR606_08585 [Vicinamibacterales bacterium]
MFDASTDVGPARELPLEAHRRFRADLRARKERNLTSRAEQLALHEEKKRAIAAWAATHATDDQRSRYAAGVLPVEDVIEALSSTLRSKPSWIVHTTTDSLARSLTSCGKGSRASGKRSSHPSVERQPSTRRRATITGLRGRRFRTCEKRPQFVRFTEPARASAVLRMPVSNSAFDRGSLSVAYINPFDLLVEGNESGNWLGVRDGIRNYLVTAA